MRRHQVTSSTSLERRLVMSQVQDTMFFEEVPQKDESVSQSTVIRTLASQGRTNGQISKELGIRYQTVWRTLHRPFQGVVPQTYLEETGIRTKEDPLVK